MATTQQQALSHLGGVIELGGVVEHSCAALDSARAAKRGLSGARATRCEELIQMIADVVAFAERLEFICEGDARADGAQR